MYWSHPLVLAHQFFLSRCAPHHQSALMGGVANECRRRFNHADADGDYFFHFIGKLTLLLEFVPCCPMNLFHHVYCIGDVYLQNPFFEKKCMTSWQKSLLVCLWSFSLSSDFLFISCLVVHIPTHPHPSMSSTISAMNSHVVLFRFHFICLVRSIAPLKANKREEVASFVLWWSCRLLIFFLNELQSLWRLLRGRSHTLPWRLRDSLRGP